MNARSLARMLVVVAFACAGVWLGSEFAAAQTVGTEATEPTTVQNGNESSGSTASSAPVTAGNTTTMQSGPAANNGGRAAMVGDTNTSVSQDNEASSGPANAGSQTSKPGKGSTEQNTNRSTNATAASGPVASFNTIDAHNGPWADGEGADASMVGDGNLDIAQDAEGGSGPVNAGSQITGARTSGLGADYIVQNLNECGDAVTDCGTATSGAVLIDNTFGDTAGTGAPSGTGPVALSAAGDAATATQVGNDDAVITQRGEGFSGEAMLGSQESDMRGGGTVQNENTAANGLADSGPVAVINFGVAFVGPFASASSTANAEQVGDSSGDLDMRAEGASGDAVTGSQTTEANGDTLGHLTVQNRSASEDDTAVTGAAQVLQDVAANAGPVALATSGLTEADADASLVGNAAFDITVRGDATSGDSAAGFQDTKAEDGAVVQNDNTSTGNDALSGNAIVGNTLTTVAGPLATSNPEPASADQVGDSNAEFDLRGEALSGDAGVGFQDTTARGNSVVQNENSSTGDTATSGDAVSTNDVFGIAGPSADGTTAPADAEQVGDANLEVDARVESETGDALTGFQIVEAGRRVALDTGDIVVQDVNESSVNASLTGDALSGNLGTFFSGPVAGLPDTFVTSTGNAVLAHGVPGSSATLEGDSSLETDLRAESLSGDARIGGQDTEAQAGTVANDNRSDNSLATSAHACAAPTCSGEITDVTGATATVPGGNTAFVIAGPSAGGAGEADATMSGNADATFGQRAEATSGDAAAAVQDTRTRGDSTVQNTNESTGISAGCFDPADCQVTAGNDAQALVGAFAFAHATFVADASQVGDSILDGGVRGAQRSEAVGGDTFAGYQATDVDTGSIVQNGNATDGVFAEAGPAMAFNALGINPFDPTDASFLTVIGAAAVANAGVDTSASLVGDASAEIGMRVEVTSGDATTGAQITVLRRAAGLVQNDNQSGCDPVTLVCDNAVSGPAQAFNAVGGSVGPLNADQVGNPSADVDLAVEIGSGNAIAGSQIISDSGTATFATTGDDPISLSAAAGQAFGSEGSDGAFRWTSGGFVGRGIAEVA